MKKKILSVLLAGAMVLSMTACGNGEDNGTGYFYLSYGGDYSYNQWNC